MIRGSTSTNQPGALLLSRQWEGRELCGQENRLMKPPELGGWITAGWMGMQRAQKPAGRLFGKVGFQAACKSKKEIYERITRRAIQLRLFLSYRIQGQKQVEHFRRKLFFLIDTTLYANINSFIQQIVVGNTGRA